MIGRLVAWAKELLAEIRSMHKVFREYAGFERAVFEAATYGIGPEEINEASTHPELMGNGTYGRTAILARCLMFLAAVGLPPGARIPVLVGIVLRYQECAGPCTMPDHLLHNCSMALAHSLGRGRVARQEYVQFVEALPQFRSTHGMEAGSDRILQWFMSAGKPNMVFQYPAP